MGPLLIQGCIYAIAQGYRIQSVIFDINSSTWRWEKWIMGVCSGNWAVPTTDVLVGRSTSRRSLVRRLATISSLVPNLLPNRWLPMFILCPSSVIWERVKVDLMKRLHFAVHRNIGLRILSLAFWFFHDVKSREFKLIPNIYIYMYIKLSYQQTYLWTINCSSCEATRERLEIRISHVTNNSYNSPRRVCKGEYQSAKRF